MTTNPSTGFTPLPAYGFPNMIVDACPAFTPSTFQNWKREIKLRIAGQPGASVTQLLAKLIHVLPLSIKTEALLYMDHTENAPEARPIAAVMDMMDSRFGKNGFRKGMFVANRFRRIQTRNTGKLQRFLGEIHSMCGKDRSIGYANE